jgi:hypothetical protein
LPGGSSQVWPLEPIQIAPESRTTGISAAANPPATGSSAFARATRLETTITATGLSSGSVLHNEVGGDMFHSFVLFILHGIESAA